MAWMQFADSALISGPLILTFLAFFSLTIWKIDHSYGILSNIDSNHDFLYETDLKNIIDLQK